MKIFSLNGNPRSLGEIARDVVINFANKYPALPAQLIRDFFVLNCANAGVSHIVETESEYHTRDGQPSQERTVKEIIIPNGEKLYVSTQWRAGKAGDNFYRFMDIVNDKGWGVIK